MGTIIGHTHNPLTRAEREERLGEAWHQGDDALRQCRQGDEAPQIVNEVHTENVKRNE
jgi:hypothetical protein